MNILSNIVKQERAMDLKYIHKKQKPNTRFGFCSTRDTPILLFLADFGFSIKDLCRLQTNGKEHYKDINLLQCFTINNISI